MEVFGLPVSEHDPVFLGFMLIIAVVFAILALLFPLWFALHRLLAPLDRVLLREPYFQKSEQINCLVWPLSYLKTLIYICLIAAPNISKRKRFKDLDEIPQVGRFTTILAKIHFILACSAAGMFFVYVGYMGFFIYFWPR